MWVPRWEAGERMGQKTRGRKKGKFEKKKRQCKA